MFDWHNWFIEVIVALFFISGFVTIYTTLDEMLTRGLTKWSRGEQWARLGLTAFAFMMVGFSLLAERWNPSNSDSYANWALYVFFIPLLDSQVDRLEFYVRWAGLIGFWLITGNMRDPIFWFSIVSLEGVMLLTRFARATIRQHWYLEFGLGLWLATAYWLTQTQTALVNVLMGILMFTLMVGTTVLYWATTQRAREEHHRLVTQVNRDELTGAGSFFAFKEDSIRDLSRARSEGQPLTLAMFDIDHFKSINDHYGHAAGNYVLATVTRMIKKLLAEAPQSLSLYRTGGEEFNVLALGLSAAEAEPVGTAILRAVRGCDFQFEGNDIHVTLSMGITALVQSDMSIEDVYERADRYLYHSKQFGRDRVTNEGEIVLGG